MPDNINKADRALIDSYLKKHGATKCKQGAMSTVPEYVYRDVGKQKAARLVRKDGKSSYSDHESGYYSGVSRAKRLRESKK